MSDPNLPACCEVRKDFHYDPNTGVLTRLRRDNRGSPTPANGEWAIDGSGYRTVKWRGKHHRIHRLAWLWMTGRWPELVDHDDRDKLNNRWLNLQEVDSAGNSQNMSMASNNTSGHRGVYWHQRDAKWCVQVYRDGRNVRAGRFTEKADAIAAWHEAEKDPHRGPCGCERART